MTGDRRKFGVIDGGQEPPKGIRDLPKVGDPDETREILKRGKREVLRPLIGHLCGVVLSEDELDRVGVLMEEMFFTKGAADSAREKIKQEFPQVSPFVDKILAVYGGDRFVPTKNPAELVAEVTQMARERREQQRQTISRECGRIMTDDELDIVWSFVTAMALNSANENEIKQELLGIFPELGSYTERVLKEQKELHEDED
ncbi:MAG: hypothetical protein WA057_05615 [Candidatus Magasanikiibacteriota bacterium]